MPTLRPVRLTDCWFLYRLRHDPAVVAASFGAPPTLLRHVWWMLTQRGVIQVVEVSGKRAGWVRADRIPQGWSVSVVVAPHVRGGGLATQAIRAMARDLGHERIVAAIKPENAASRRAFLKAGFHFANASPSALYYEYRP